MKRPAASTRNEGGKSQKHWHPRNDNLAPTAAANLASRQAAYQRGKEATKAGIQTAPVTPNPKLKPATPVKPSKLAAATPKAPAKGSRPTAIKKAKKEPTAKASAKKPPAKEEPTAKASAKKLAAKAAVQKANQQPPSATVQKTKRRQPPTATVPAPKAKLQSRQAKLQAILEVSDDDTAPLARLADAPRTIDEPADAEG